MTPAEFQQTLNGAAPPDALAPALRALWWAKRGDCERAHGIVMDAGDRDSAWVHAYLHRVEGDLPNARYWYGQARRPAAQGAFDDEWHAIVAALLAAEAH